MLTQCLALLVNQVLFDMDEEECRDLSIQVTTAVSGSGIQPRGRGGATYNTDYEVGYSMNPGSLVQPPEEVRPVPFENPETCEWCVRPCTSGRIKPGCKGVFC